MKYITLKELRACIKPERYFKVGDFLRVFSVGTGPGMSRLAKYDSELMEIHALYHSASEIQIPSGFYEVIGENDIRPGMHVDHEGEKLFYVGDDERGGRILSCSASGDLVGCNEGDLLKPWKEPKPPTIDDLNPEHLEFLRDIGGDLLNTYGEGLWHLFNSGYVCVDVSKFIEKHYSWHAYEGPVEINLTPVAEEQSND